MLPMKRGSSASTGNDKCDLVIKNGKFINVFTEEIQEGDIGIIGDTIIGVGNYSGEKEIDAGGKIISPGFIDCHLHIESSMVTPESYGYVALKNGVTTVIADPHEIANVLGAEGISFMIENSKLTPLTIYFMLPSCVPAMDSEENGFILKAEGLKNFLQCEEVLGLGEVMDVSAVLNLNDEMHKKLQLFDGGNIDGHAPHLCGNQLNQYIFSGIRTDHECSTINEALEKVSKGMYVLIRDGSAAKNLKDLIGAVNERNFRRFAFCSDDKHLEDFMENGTIKNAIREAIKEGADPIKTYIMASFNGFTCYGIKGVGAIAPGYKADLVILDDLKEVKINTVIKDGKVVDRNILAHAIKKTSNTINMDYIDDSVFKIKYEGKNTNVITVRPHSLETDLKVVEGVDDNGFLKVENEGIIKIAVFERHKNTGHYAVGFIEGLGIKGCTIAQSISHDSHNIVVAGDNDKDMAKAVNSLIHMGGGICVVVDGLVQCELQLEIAGLMTDSTPGYVYEKLKNLNRIVKNQGLKEGIDPFITLSFMSLPVIPDVKITTKGLFSYNKFKYIPLSFN